MWRYDFHLFYLAGQAVLSGLSPYTIPDFNPPYPLAVLFAGVAWLPEPVAYALYLGGCLWLLWKVMGKRMIWPLLSFPVWFNLFVGQVDLPLGLLSSLLGVWALPLMLIKPQVGFVVAPWIVRQKNWKHLAQVSAIGFGFLVLSFVLRPGWVSEWLSAAPTLAQYASRDSNLYWLVPTSFKTMAVATGVLMVFPLSFLIKEKRESWIVLHLFAPLTNIYSASVLADWIGPVEVVLSWVAIFLVGDIHSGAPMFVVGFSILARKSIQLLRTRRSPDTPSLSNVE